MVELVFVPVVLGEGFVESTVSSGREYLTSDVRHGLVAGRNKTRDVRFRVMALGGESDSNSSRTSVHDRKFVIGIISLPTAMSRIHFNNVQSRASR